MSVSIVCGSAVKRVERQRTYKLELGLRRRDSRRAPRENSHQRGWESDAASGQAITMKVTSQSVPDGHVSIALIAMSREPVGGELGEFIEHVVLRERAACLRNDRNLLALRANVGQVRAIDLVQPGVMLSGHQQRRCAKTSQRPPREIESPAANDDGTNDLRPVRGALQGDGRGRADAHKANGQASQLRLSFAPVEDRDQARREKRDVAAELARELAEHFLLG